MAVEIIRVRKKNNHDLQRSIKANALSTFAKRGWEAVPGQSITTTSATTEVKKKDVEPAEVPVSETEEVDIKPEGEPFAQIGDDAEGESLEALREEYQKVSGKAADKRWKAERLSDEISKANGN